MYYYFAASLPMITFEGPLPFESAVFLQDCERILSSEDYREMQVAFEGCAADRCSARNPTLKQWLRFLLNLRNEAALLRATGANKNPLEYVRGEREADPFLMDVLEEAMKASDPLEAERIIDRACFRFLDEIGQQHYFDLDALIIYGIKLRTLERYQKIQSLEGAGRLREYREGVLAKGV